MLGILGGMGPMATVDFLRKLVEATPAARDQDHLETVTVSAAGIPDRIAGLRGSGPDPLPAMIVALRRLEAAGATRVAIACNTAHHWHAKLQEATSLPILHIVDAVVDALTLKHVPRGPVGLLATTATLETGLYQERLAARGFECRPPLDPDAIMAAIALVKAGRTDEAVLPFRTQAQTLLAQGCGQIVLGCTEIPIALAHEPDLLSRMLLDATEALARACVTACRADERALLRHAS